MGQTDPRIDKYIARAADFAKPILTHLRKVVHAACPDVEETMKWSAPHFDYKGMMCGMAAFKSHCAFGFWKGSLVLDGPRSDDAAGHFGRITSLSDLPSDRVIAGYVKKAAKLNDEGVKVARKSSSAEEAAADAGGLCSRLEEEASRAESLRGVQPESQARVRRMGDRGKNRRDTTEADGDGRRLAVGG